MRVGVVVISPMEDPARGFSRGFSEYVFDSRLMSFLQILRDLDLVFLVKLAVSLVLCVLLLLLGKTSNPEAKRLKS